MSFDKKKYPKSKDARRRFHRYHDSRDVDGSCRNQGGCGWCESNRTFGTQKRIAEAKAKAEQP